MSLRDPNCLRCLEGGEGPHAPDCRAGRARPGPQYGPFVQALHQEYIQKLAPIDQEGVRVDVPEQARKRYLTEAPDCFNCGHEAALHDPEEGGLGPCAGDGCECPVYRDHEHDPKERMLAAEPIPREQRLTEVLLEDQDGELRRVIL